MQETIHPFLAHLGLGLSADDRAIRRAYARLLKQTDQEAAPEEFQALRQAYETALFWYAQHTQAAQGAEVASDPDGSQGQHGTEPNPKDKTSTGAEAKSVLDATVLAIQPAAPPSATHNSEDIARALLAEMQEKLASGWPGDRDTARAWLDQTMDGDRLLDMDARFLFEWGVAGVLADGWAPGKEFLFGPAIECFGWREERGRLVAFGRAGEIVTAAIAELEFFDSLPQSVRDDQRRVIRKLREDDRPTTSALLTQMPVAEHITRLYPHWLHIITNTHNVEQWRQWGAQIPQWRQRFSRIPRALTVQLRSVGNNNWRWAWGLVIVLALSSLGKIAGQFSSPRPMASASNNGAFLGLKPPAPTAISSEAKNSERESVLRGLPPRSSADAIPIPSRQSSLYEGTAPMERPAIHASYLISPKLSYPPLARRRGQEGRVILSVIVDPDGKVRRTKVEKSSGHLTLDEAAIAAVQAATFNPAKNLAGAAIASSYKLPFNFTLSDEPSLKTRGHLSYGDAIRDAVLPHIVFNDPAAGNPVAEVTLKLAEDGRIQSHQLTSPSGNRAWDAAVLRALQRVQKLPVDYNGKVPPEIIIAFKPRA